ncbi:hypothetical protein NPIL_694621 [Nephila pilipes]|uniref:Uncharacterized protein n=1 Tax=Nephila pilipes TaxID=299642 RepID=A0A8X6P6U7_NEPPI|nr:hypothetical protein NPIL_694621 [Nephila pilipes]
MKRYLAARRSIDRHKDNQQKLLLSVAKNYPVEISAWDVVLICTIGQEILSPYGCTIRKLRMTAEENWLSDKMAIQNIIPN